MRRLKVDVDLDSGSVVIKTTIWDFGELATAAALNCYDSIEADRKLKPPHRAEEALAYHKGLLAFIRGIEELIRMQRWPDTCEDPIPLIARSVKERWAAVEQERKERQLLDKITDEALATARAKPLVCLCFANGGERLMLQHYPECPVGIRDQKEA